MTFSLVLTHSGKGCYHVHFIHSLPPSNILCGGSPNYRYPTSVLSAPNVSLHILSPVVFSFGSAESGQLGNGRTGERITTGNKSAFDIEWEPSCVAGCRYKQLIEKRTEIICSSGLGARNAQDRANHMRAATQYGTWRRWVRHAPISLR